MKARVFVSIFTLCLLVFFCCPPSAFSQPMAEPVKCLWIGTESHDEVTMDDVIRELEESYSNIALTVTEDYEDLRIDNLKNYDVLVAVQIKAEKGNLPDEVKSGIIEFLQGGGGLVAVHFVVANVQEWRDSIDIFGAMWVNGKSTHDPYHEFSVDMADETHPIVAGVKPFVTNDELYFNLLMRPDMHVIMTADQERMGHRIPEPMLATHYCYNARCVYFALGHDVQSTAIPEYRKIMAQSIEWAACRR
ncbi:MAG: ThuA domain-containing protein [Candidatus Hydrogenedentes bacterium]|jgi:type 1 glutamine amidotransferase|nr:ThuA domain-containing protein [Candidatus Hydrogenedentota bacterium]